MNWGRTADKEDEESTKQYQQSRLKSGIFGRSTAYLRRTLRLDVVADSEVGEMRAGRAVGDTDDGVRKSNVTGKEDIRERRHNTASVRHRWSWGKQNVCHGLRGESNVLGWSAGNFLGKRWTL